MKLTSSMSLQVRVDLADRVAQRAVERVDRAVALGGAHVALAVDPDLDRRLGLDLAVGALLDDHAPGLQPEQRLVLAGLLAHQQLERAVGGLEVVAAVLELLDALDQPRAPRRRRARCRPPRPSRRPCRGPHSSEISSSRRLPTIAGSTCSNVAASALTPATCMPPLCANALLADVRLARVGREVEQLVEEVRRLGQLRELVVGQHLVAQLELRGWR